MKINILSLLILTTLTNCVSTKIVPLSVDKSSLKGRTIVIVHNEKSNFSAGTYKNMMLAGLTGGILGYVSMVHDGNKIVNENAIEDPAILISYNLAENLKSMYDVKITNDKTIQKTSNTVGTISNQYRNTADYALDVKTVNWGFGYLPFKPNNFKVLYSSKLKLIDIKNSKIIAEGFCEKQLSAREINTPPTYKELLNDHAKLLKEEISKSVAVCTDLFKEKVLNFN